MKLPSTAWCLDFLSNRELDAPETLNIQKLWRAKVCGNLVLGGNLTVIWIAVEICALCLHDHLKQWGDSLLLSEDQAGSCITLQLPTVAPGSAHLTSESYIKFPSLSGQHHAQLCWDLGSTAAAGDTAQLSSLWMGRDGEETACGWRLVHMWTCPPQRGKCPHTSCGEKYVWKNLAVINVIKNTYVGFVKPGTSVLNSALITLWGF